VPDRRSIFRLLALAGFLLTVALALWLAEVRPLLVIIVMALALGVAWSVEWFSWRQEVPREVVVEAGASAEAEEGITVLPAAEVPAAPPPPEPVVEAEPEPVVEAPPAPVLVPPAAAPEPPPAIEPPAPEPEPIPEPVAAPPPPRPPLRPVPPPPPEPAPPLPPAAEPVRPAASSEVVDLRMRATMQPRRWNLWDLERRARDELPRDPIRYEEWSYLFVHLRQFATPDGSLPTEFDGLVRESFGELLEHAG
jgi:outer membrane biosynthesis protein TonB